MLFGDATSGVQTDVITQTNLRTEQKQSFVLTFHSRRLLRSPCNNFILYSSPFSAHRTTLQEQKTLFYCSRDWRIASHDDLGWRDVAETMPSEDKGVFFTAPFEVWLVLQEVRTLV